MNCKNENVLNIVILDVRVTILHVFFFEGGVLEGNEIFNNRFEGICLATGVKPELKGEDFMMLNQ